MRHARLRTLAAGVYRIPGSRMLARRMTRLAIMRFGLRQIDRERLYNFVSPDTVPADSIRCSVLINDHREITVDLDLFDMIARQWYYFGYDRYERPTVRAIRQLAPTARTVIEVGSNIGYHSLLTAALVPPGGVVHALEPSPAIFAQLAANARLNPRLPLVVAQLAASDTNGQAALYIPAADSDDRHDANASLLPDFWPSDRTVTVRCVRLDTYCHEQGIDHIDLLKIDAEGAEPAVLRGLQPMLATHRPTIIIEVLAPYAAEIEAFANTWGYQRFLLTDHGSHLTASVEGDTRFRDYLLVPC